MKVTLTLRSTLIEAMLVPPYDDILRVLNPSENNTFELVSKMIRAVDAVCKDRDLNYKLTYLHGMDITKSYRISKMLINE